MGRYIVEPLNKVNSTYKKGSLSGTKNFPNDTSSGKAKTPVRNSKSRASVHKSSEEFATQKRQINARYNKNLKEIKHFWSLKVLTSFIKKNHPIQVLKSLHIRKLKVFQKLSLSVHRFQNKKFFKNPLFQIKQNLWKSQSLTSLLTRMLHILPRYWKMLRAKEG